MVDRYWVGGSGTWSTSTTNWSASSGGAGGATVPGSGDNAFFDQSGSYTVTISGTRNCANLTITSTGVTFSGTTTPTLYIYGNLSVVSGAQNPVFTTATTQIIFASTTAQTISVPTVGLSNGPVYFNGIGGSWQLQTNFSNAYNTLAIVYLTNGTLDLNGYTLSCALFNGYNVNTKSILFGSSGQISVTCGNTGTIYQISATGTTITGTPSVSITTITGTTSTLILGAFPEAQAPSLNITGPGTATFNTSGDAVKNLSFTGFTGSVTARTNNLTIYGNCTFNGSGTVPTSAAAYVFSASSGTQSLTTNGNTINAPITISGSGTGVVQMADNLTMGSTRSLTLNGGAFDTNGNTFSGATSIISSGGSTIIKNLNTTIQFIHTAGNITLGANNTLGAYLFAAGNLDLGGFTLSIPSYQSNAGTKNITFNGGTMAISAATTSAFNNSTSTGFTTTAGSGIGKISMTASTAKTFIGGGSTFYCTLSNDGAGALTITGANTFTGIANGSPSTSFVFPSSTTTTLSNWSVSGSLGNIVTITSSTSGTAATISQATGIITSNYLSLKDSAATGGATWYAGANSTNVSGNSGWIFSNAPSVNGNFFFMF